MQNELVSSAVRRCTFLSLLGFYGEGLVSLSYLFGSLICLCFTLPLFLSLCLCLCDCFTEVLDVIACSTSSVTLSQSQFFSLFLSLFSHSVLLSSLLFDVHLLLLSLSLFHSLCAPLCLSVSSLRVSLFCISL